MGIVQTEQGCVPKRQGTGYCPALRAELQAPERALPSKAS